MSDSTVALAVLNLIAIVLVLVVLPSQIRSANVPVLFLAAWLIIINWMRGFNGLLWRDSTIPRAKVYCDIFTRLDYAAAIGFEIALFCVIRNLESITSGRGGIQTAQDRKRRKIIDLILCISFPVIMIAFYSGFIQTTRFSIFESYGCSPALDYTWVYITFTIVPIFTLSFLSSAYACATIYWFLQRRSQFNDLLMSSGSGLNRSRYTRLIGLSLCQLVISVVLESVQLALSLRSSGGLIPYNGLKLLHTAFGEIPQYPLVFLNPAVISQLKFYKLSSFVSAIIFFVFFGTSEDAIRDYIAVYNFVRVKIFRMKPYVRGAAARSAGTRTTIKSLPSFKVPPTATTESYDLEAKWPKSSEFDGNDYVPSSPAAPAYSKHVEATASRLSVPVSMTDGNSEREHTATQVSMSDRASVALSYDEDFENHHSRDSMTTPPPMNGETRPGHAA